MKNEYTRYSVKCFIMNVNNCFIFPKFRNNKFKKNNELF